MKKLIKFGFLAWLSLAGYAHTADTTKYFFTPNEPYSLNDAFELEEEGKVFKKDTQLITGTLWTATDFLKPTTYKRVYTNARISLKDYKKLNSGSYQSVKLVEFGQLETLDTQKGESIALKLMQSNISKNLDLKEKEAIDDYYKDLHKDNYWIIKKQESRFSQRKKISFSCKHKKTEKMQNLTFSILNLQHRQVNDLLIDENKNIALLTEKNLIPAEVSPYSAILELDDVHKFEFNKYPVKLYNENKESVGTVIMESSAIEGIINQFAKDKTETTKKNLLLNNILIETKPGLRKINPINLTLIFYEDQSQVIKEAESFTKLAAKFKKLFEDKYYTDCPEFDDSKISFKVRRDGIFAIPSIGIDACLKKSTGEIQVQEKIIWITLHDAQNPPKNNLVKSIDDDLLVLSENTKTKIQKALPSGEAWKTYLQAQAINTALFGAGAAAGWYLAPEEYRGYARQALEKTIEHTWPWIKKGGERIQKAIRNR